MFADQRKASLLRPELFDQTGEACLLAYGRGWRGGTGLGVVGTAAQLRRWRVLAEALGGRLDARPLRRCRRLKGIAPDGRMGRNVDLDGGCRCGLNRIGGAVGIEGLGPPAVYNLVEE